MNDIKKMFLRIGIFVGVLFTIFFTLYQILYPMWINVLIFVVLLIVSEGFIFTLYMDYKKSYVLNLDKDKKSYLKIGMQLSELGSRIDPLITEIERLRLDLNSKDAQISMMSSYSLQGIILIDSKKNIIYSNAKSSELLSLVDSKNASYISQIRFAHIKEQIENTFLTQETTSKTYLIHHKNLSIKTVPSGKKDDLHVLLLIDDLSEKIRLETVKKDFFSYAGHELKTPITILKGYADLIYNHIISGEEAHIAAGKMIEQSDYMNAFVDDMLMLSRLETFTDLPLQNVDLKKTLLDTLDIYSKDIIKKELKVSLYADDIIMEADSIDIQKLFKNMIENAVKYNVEKGTIDIRLEKHTNQMVFSIKDSGLGIPFEDISRVFERFYRVNQLRKIPGTGLGLSIVKHIVNKYNGHINVESEVNKFTKFTIII